MAVLKTTAVAVFKTAAKQKPLQFCHFFFCSDLFLYVESAYSMVVRDERHSLITRDRDASYDTVVFVTRSNEKMLFCFVCAKMGHSTSDAFRSFHTRMVGPTRKHWS